MFTRRPIAPASLVFALGFLVFAVLADRAAAAPADADDARARQAYARGAELYQSHHFAEAAAAFSEGYRAKPHHAFLWNLALAYHAQGDHAKAIEAYKSYLKACPANAIADRAAAQAAMAEEEGNLAASAKVEPPPAPSPVTSDAPAAPAVAVAAPVLGHAAGPASGASGENGKVWRKWWFWTATGAAVAALGIGLGVGLAPVSTAPYREVTWR